MSLPIRTTPQYDLILPSNKKKIKFRPYSVKEQSILLMAAESKEMVDIINATKQIVQACIVAPDNLDVDKLTSFDIQYFFVNLRARSVGEKVERKYQCTNVIDDQSCDTINSFEVDLTKTIVKNYKENSNTIKFSNGTGVVLNYPTLGSSEVFKKDIKDQFSLLIQLVMNDIQYVFDEEKIFDEYTKEELQEFIETLMITDLNKITEFYSTIPYLSYTINYECRKCGHKEDIELTGLEDFFI